MAIRDALWACPACHAFGAIRKDGSDEACSQCAARFDRTGGALIRMRDRHGDTVVRTLPEWESLLPPLDQPPVNRVLGPQNALVRNATPPAPVRVPRHGGTLRTRA